MLSNKILISSNTAWNLINFRKGIILELINKDFEVIFLTGDSQAVTVPGNYELAESILKFAKKYKVKTILTLGGLGTGQTKDNPTIYGAYTNEKIRDKSRN